MFSKPLNIPEISNLSLVVKPKVEPKKTIKFELSKMLSAQEYCKFSLDSLPMYGRDELKTHTMTWINQIREQHGVGPIDVLPKGYERDENGCVIANSFKDIDSRVIASPGIVVVGGKELRQIPEPVNSFMRMFDLGAFPELSSRGRPYQSSANKDLLATIAVVSQPGMMDSKQFQQYTKYLQGSFKEADNKIPQLA